MLAASQDAGPGRLIFGRRSRRIVGRHVTDQRHIALHEFAGVPDQSGYRNRDDLIRIGWWLGAVRLKIAVGEKHHPIEATVMMDTGRRRGQWQGIALSIHRHGNPDHRHFGLFIETPEVGVELVDDRPQFSRHLAGGVGAAMGIDGHFEDHSGDRHHGHQQGHGHQQLEDRERLVGISSHGDLSTIDPDRRRHRDCGRRPSAG